MSRWSLLIATALLWSCSSDDSSCPSTSKNVQLDGAQSCVFDKRQSEIIETGFECPADFPTLSSFDDLVVCSTDPLSDQGRTELEEEYPDASLRECETLLCDTNNSNNVNNTNNANNVNNTNNSNNASGAFDDVANLVRNSCAQIACHGAAGLTWNIAQSTNATDDEIFEVLTSDFQTASGLPLIAPNDSTGSEVIARMSLANGTEGAMPPDTGSPDSDIQIVQDWILGGATR